MEFMESLEVAFEQADCMFGTDVDLAIENYKKQKKER